MSRAVSSLQSSVLEMQLKQVQMEFDQLTGRCSVIHNQDGKVVYLNMSKKAQRKQQELFRLQQEQRDLTCR